MKYIKKYNEKIDFDDIVEEEFNIPEDFIGNEQFYNLLVKHGVLDKYIKYFNPNFTKSGDNLKEFFQNTNKSDYINYAFLWEDTDGGDDFWNELHDEWRYMLGIFESIKINNKPLSEDINFDDIDYEEYDNDYIPETFSEVPEFYKFLIEKNLYNRFLELYDPVFDEGTIISLEKYFNIYKDKQQFLFGRAFEWGFTKEDFDYWDKISNEWITRVLDRR